MNLSLNLARTVDNSKCSKSVLSSVAEAAVAAAVGSVGLS